LGGGVSRQARLWIAGGIVLDLAGAVLIARSLPQMGVAMGTGIAMLLAGSIVVFQGALRMAQENRAATESTGVALRESDWSPEIELQLSVPRPVKLTRTGMLSTGLWLMLAIAALGFVFLAPPPSARIPELLEDAGVKVSGTVHRKDERKNSAGLPSYFISYHFATQSGDQVRASKSVPKDVYDSLTVGNSIEVIYFPYDPQQHVAPSLERHDMPAAMRWSAVGFIAVLLIGFEQQRRFHRKLVSEGKAVAGVIESLRKRGGSRVFTVRFAVKGQERTLRGSERHLDRADGDVVTVLYLPDKPDRALIYSSSLYRAGTS
jgi:hypothetical protein